MKTTLMIAEADNELREAYRMFFTIHNDEAIMTTDGLECLQVYHPYFASSANGITAVGALAKR